MLWSKTLISTLKETPQEAETLSHQLMLRAGLIRMLMSGVYSYLPLGFRVLSNIEKIIRDEMDRSNAVEVLLPTLQPLELWKESGRDEVLGEVMVRFVDRRGRKICLGPTHEEVITDLIKNYVSSYRQLPFILYQIQTKFRDEMRPRFGLVRACEFIMKDAYSFDVDQAGLEKNYRLMYDAYHRIFKRCGLNFVSVEADSGVMGGSVSHEFMVPAKDGEDVVLKCKNCSHAFAFKEERCGNCPQCGGDLEKTNTLEVGHIFQLGTKYSTVLKANFVDIKGKPQPIIMGCYGIGVSRLIPAVIECNHDALGVIWPKELAPYQVEIIAIDVTDELIMNQANLIHQELQGQGISVLLDDRDERAGVKFKDADLIGSTAQIVIGREFLEKNHLELKVRRTQEKSNGPKESIYRQLQEIING